MSQEYSNHLQGPHRLVLLDRDGVINHDSEDYIKNISEWSPIDGSIAAIVKLQLQNIKVAVCTNQSGLARGLFKTTDLLPIHEECNLMLKKAGGQSINFFFCPHHPSDDCNCRKPKPGLLQAAMDDFAIENRETIFLGDSTSDWHASKACKVDFALVMTGNGNKTLEELNLTGLNGIKCHLNLAQYADSLNF